MGYLLEMESSAEAVLRTSSSPGLRHFFTAHANEVVRSGLWVRRDPARVAQRVSRFNDAATELILKLLLARGIAMRNGTGTTPGMGHRSDGVATPQTRGFDGRTQYWHGSLSRDGSLQRRPDGQFSSAHEQMVRPR